MQPETTPKKILCIEDEPFISDLYARALTKAGYSIDVVADGKEGLAAIQTNTYDVVLLDIMIPQLMGVDILYEIKDQRQNLKAKIIICTNLEQDDETRAQIEAQADGYLIKAEITPRQLVEIVSQL